jgi:ADP-ribose pyrophosphatase
MKARRLKRRVIYRSPWVNLYLDKVQMPSGQVIETFHFLDHDIPAVGVLVEDARGRFLLERVYRYTTDTTGWELPAGGIDPGESPLKAAQREVFEETGYETRSPRLIYKFHPTNGTSNKTFYIVHVRAGRQTGSVDPHEVQAIRWASRRELLRMVRAKAFRDGLSLTGVLLWELRRRTT